MPGSMDLSPTFYFYEIDTPLRTFVASHPNLVRHCNSIYAAVKG